MIGVLDRPAEVLQKLLNAEQASFNMPYMRHYAMKTKVKHTTGKKWHGMTWIPSVKFIKLDFADVITWNVAHLQDTLHKQLIRKGHPKIYWDGLLVARRAAYRERLVALPTTSEFINNYLLTHRDEYVAMPEQYISEWHDNFDQEESKYIGYPGYKDSTEWPMIELISALEKAAGNTEIVSPCDYKYPMELYLLQLQGHPITGYYTEKMQMPIIKDYGRPYQNSVPNPLISDIYYYAINGRVPKKFDNTIRMPELSIKSLFTDDIHQIRGYSCRKWMWKTSNFQQIMQHMRKEIFHELYQELLSEPLTSLIERYSSPPESITLEERDEFFELPLGLLEEVQEDIIPLTEVDFNEEESADDTPSHDDVESDNSSESDSNEADEELKSSLRADVLRLTVSSKTPTDYG
jgi:hypothetical protein